MLLRVAWREGQKVRKRTLLNLTGWPADRIEALRRLLQGEKLVPAGELLTIQRSRPHGHVEAILLAIRKLGLETLIAAKRCRARDLVVAMIAERLIHPCSKLACTRHWNDTTLAEELGVADAEVDGIYVVRTRELAARLSPDKRNANARPPRASRFRVGTPCWRIWPPVPGTRADSNCRTTPGRVRPSSN